MKKIKDFVKRYWNKAISIFCIVIIAAYTAFSTFSVYAAGEPTSWDDVTEDVIALRDSYFNYFNSFSSGSFGTIFKSAADIPISWLKSVTDIGWAISPMDDLYYYLNGDTLEYQDGRHSGGGGGRRRGAATDIKPDVSASFIKDYYKEYASRYMPMPNEEQYIYSYQNAPGSHIVSDYYGYYHFGPMCPVYTASKTWGDKEWTEVYILPFLYDDDFSDPYYSQSYFHFYSGKNDDGVPTLYVDQIMLQDQTVNYSNSTAWGSYTYITFYVDTKYGQSVGGIRTDSSSVYYSSVNQTSFSGGSFGCSNYKTGFSSGSIFSPSSSIITNLMKASSFSPDTNKADDWGYILSSKPFDMVLNQDSIDFDKIPDNYVITINGDTIYNYPISNPETGQSTTITNYITNNYTLPEKEPSGGDDSGGSSGGSGTVNGNVVVGGKVDVSGKIDISTNPIDININVNNSGSGSSGGAGTGEISGVEFDQDLSLNNYYDWMQQQTTGFSGFMKQFLSWLPEDILIMLCAGLALVILARFLGR